MNVYRLMFEYDSKPTIGFGGCCLILKSTFMTPKKGVTCCQVFSDSPAGDEVGTAHAVVQVQPVVIRSPRGGAVRPQRGLGPSLPVTRFGD